MRLELRPARDDERGFCEWLSRSNMSGYLAARKTLWEPTRFEASWFAFENLMIVADESAIGVLRLMPQRDALEIRDLQLVPERQGQGIGSWAVRQATRLATARGLASVRLRVYEENPAMQLYLRLGFVISVRVEGTAHMCLDLPADGQAAGRPS